MNIKNRLGCFIRGWFPEETKLPRDKIKIFETKAKVSKPMPWWWKPLLIVSILICIVFAVAGFFLFDASLVRVVAGLALSFLGICFAYYIRVRPSMNVNRALYILLGGGVTYWIIFGGTAFIIWATGLPPPTQYLGPWITNIIFMIAPWIIGAFIGDWIGKRRNYLLPLNPWAGD